ncbi:MAG TPA: hypothetical protein VIL11_00525 [Limnochordales bacterium]
MMDGMGTLGRAALAAALSTSFRQAVQRAVPAVAQALRQAGLVRRSRSGQELPTAVGVVPAALGWAGAAALGRPAWAAAGACAAAAGWVDDVAGQSEPKGLAGHLRASWNGRTLTTGAWKALVIGAASGLAALTAHGRPRGAGALAQAASVALAANVLNQLDTRPGQAAAAFLGGWGYLAWRALATPSRRLGWLPYLPCAAAVAAYLPFDREGRVMMGDTGANALGACLGAMAADILPGRQLARWVAALALATAAMDRVSAGRWLDRVGEAVRRLAADQAADGRKALADGRSWAAQPAGTAGALPASRGA